MGRLVRIRGRGFAGELIGELFANKEEVRAAEPEAWARLGRQFLDGWKHSEVPPALRKYGEPETVRCP